MSDFHQRKLRHVYNHEAVRVSFDVEDQVAGLGRQSAILFPQKVDVV
jgi:hypothetical protein